MSDDAEWDDVPDMLDGLVENADFQSWGMAAGSAAHLRNQQQQLEQQRKAAERQAAAHREAAKSQEQVAQELRALRELQQAEAAKAQEEAARLNALPQCPACGARLEGRFTKCKHCASEITWLAVCPLACGLVLANGPDTIGKCPKCKKAIPDSLSLLNWMPTLQANKKRVAEKLFENAKKKFDDLIVDDVQRFLSAKQFDQVFLLLPKLLDQNRSSALRRQCMEIEREYKERIASNERAERDRIARLTQRLKELDSQLLICRDPAAREELLLDRQYLDPDNQAVNNELQDIAKSAQLRQAQELTAAKAAKFRMTALILGATVGCVILIGYVLNRITQPSDLAIDSEIVAIVPPTRKAAATPTATAPASSPVFKSGDVQVNSIGMKLVLIPAGEFMMGSTTDDPDAEDDEKPQHRVRLTKPFYLGQTEVTQGQWQAVMETTPWSGKSWVREGSEYAATYLSWNDAQEFCSKLSSKEGKSYRLPTEAEWEYACRAGTTTRYSFGDDESRLSDYAWWGGGLLGGGGNAKKNAEVVGTKRANSWGLYDMHGNVWEWCSDLYDEKFYGESPVSNPIGPLGLYRVFRGGCWCFPPENCRSADRHWNTLHFQDNTLGFRVALIP